MSSLIIFWSSVMFILIFLLGVFFKGVIAVLKGISTAVSKVGAKCGIMLGVIIVMHFLSGMDFVVGDAVNVDSINILRIIDIISKIGLIVLIGVGITVFFSWVWTVLLTLFGVLMSIVIFILGLISSMLEWLANTCEKYYTHFLQVIVKRLGCN